MRLLILICLVLGVVVDAAVIKSSLTNHESKIGRLLREGRFLESRALRTINRSVKYANLASGKLPFTVDSDITYTVNLTVGTPPQHFTVVVDTTWSSFWVPDVTFAPSGDDCVQGCEKLNHFDSTKSSSYYSPGPIFTPPGGDSPIIGNIGFDTVALGDLNVPNSTVGMITELHNGYRLEYDGLLGMGLYFDPNTPEVKPVIRTAVDSGLLDQPLFTIWLENKGSSASGANGGQLTLGAIDSEHCSTDNVFYAPTNENSYWRFAIDGVSVNGLKTKASWNAISDSGAQINFVPSGVLNDLARFTGATYDFQTGLYTVDCNAKFTWSLLFGDKQLDTDETVSIIKFGDTCYLGFESWDSEYGFDVVLGDLFIRSWCQIYDLSGRIGFAKSIVN